MYLQRCLIGGEWSGGTKWIFFWHLLSWTVSIKAMVSVCVYMVGGGDTVIWTFLCLLHCMEIQSLLWWCISYFPVLVTKIHGRNGFILVHGFIISVHHSREGMAGKLGFYLWAECAGVCSHWGRIRSRERGARWYSADILIPPPPLLYLSPRSWGGVTRIQGGSF